MKMRNIVNGVKNEVVPFLAVVFLLFMGGRKLVEAFGWERLLAAWLLISFLICIPMLYAALRTKTDRWHAH